MRLFRLFPLLAAAFLVVCLASPAWGQAVYNWNGASSGSGNTGQAWIRANTTGVNWINGVSGKMPGVDANTSTTIDGNANDVAVFNLSANTTIVIGMSNSSTSGVTNNGAANGFLSVGAISTVTGTGQATINASSAAPSGVGILQLNGALAGNSAGLAANTLVSATSGNVQFIRDSAGNLLDMRLGIDGGIFTASSGRAINVAMNIGEAAGGPKGFIKEGAGTLILTGTNTYTGTTAIAAGTLRMTNNGSINTTPTITAASGSTFDVALVTGGYTLGSTTAQTIQGLGTVSGAVTVAPGSTLRADTGTGTGTLTFANNIALTGDATAGARMQMAVSRTGANTADAGLLNVTGAASVLNLGVGGSKFRIDLKAGSNALTTDGTETYTITLASVATAGNIQLNGSSQAANTTIANSNFDLTSSDFTFTSYSLAIDSTGTLLRLTFTPAPVPEPATVVGIGAAALALGAFVRRRWASRPL